VMRLRSLGRLVVMAVRMVMRAHVRVVRRVHLWIPGLPAR
jgi:hypothetical protein